MKRAEAAAIINGEDKPPGYRVCFNVRDGICLRGDFFPDRDEPPIPNEEEAWRLARAFADKTRGKCVDIYVITADWRPVAGYQSKEIDNR